MRSRKSPNNSIATAIAIVFLSSSSSSLCLSLVLLVPPYNIQFETINNFVILFIRVMGKVNIAVDSALDAENNWIHLHGGFCRQPCTQWICTLQLLIRAIAFANAYQVRVVALSPQIAHMSDTILHELAGLSNTFMHTKRASSRSRLRREYTYFHCDYSALWLVDCSNLFESRNNCNIFFVFFSSRFSCFLYSGRFVGAS